MQIKELTELLKYHDDLYYNQDTPELSDVEYDALKAKYVELTGSEYTYVPGEAKFDKFNHTTPILSLDKVQITDDNKLRTEIERLWPVIIQPKMDGLTVVFYPNTRTYVTRGNGHIGENITDKITNVIGRGHEVGINNPIRSEVVMLISEFNKINEERKELGLELFKNPRNAAAGMLRNKDSSKVKGLVSFAYNIISPGIENNYTKEQINILSQTYYWNAVPTFEPNTVDEAINYIKSYDRTVLDYEIDGLVVKHNGPKEFGATGHHPKNAIAVKFEAEGQWTTLSRIVWQVGRTGKITPVAEFEPIDLLGAEVTRATLHNFGIMKSLGLEWIQYKGKYTPVTEVFVVKANDVIPAIIEVRNPSMTEENIYVENFKEPDSCPQCKGEVEKVNDQVFCINPDCSAKLQGQIELLASRDALNIEGLSQMTIEKMIEYYKNNEVAFYQPQDFTLPFYFSYEDILKLEGFAPISAKKLYDNIQKAKDTELKRFIYASCIPLIGRSASEDMANTFLNINSLVEDVNNDFIKTSEIPDFGPKMINSLNKYARDHFSKLWDAGVRPLEVVETAKKLDADKVLTIVVTGAFDISRKEIETLIKDAGHKVSGSVSKKTSYLLASPGEEGTTKYKKAKELNIQIINSLDELNNII